MWHAQIQLRFLALKIYSKNSISCKFTWNSFFGTRNSEMDSTHKIDLNANFHENLSISKKFHLTQIWPPVNFLYFVKCRNVLIICMTYSSQNFNWNLKQNFGNYGGVESDRCRFFLYLCVFLRNTKSIIFSL